MKRALMLLGALALFACGGDKGAKGEDEVKVVEEATKKAEAEISLENADEEAARLEAELAAELKE